MIQCRAQQDGKRIDVFLKELTGLSRSQIQRAIHQKRVKVNQITVIKSSYRLKEGDIIIFSSPQNEPITLEPEPIPLEIVYEDEHLIVLNKPSGMVVHPAPGHYKSTLVHGLLYHCPELMGVGSEKRPGIVHRLDKETSGVLVVAKTSIAHQCLSLQFKERIVEKEYLALVFGVPTRKKGEIGLSVGRHPKDRKRISIHTKKPRFALTYWELKEVFPFTALLLCKPKTGRTHQIRVHLCAIGHPILGDSLYFRKSKLNEIKSKPVRDFLRRTPRLMLHALSIKFMHPVTGEKKKFEAPLPHDMYEFMQTLKRLGNA
ncbi:MAG TPA: RluA family pseudouridine synthase [Thermoplasmatales archaeon]|nr:RluA family pseudouridine synthase [Thermoplasmatales archaeon]